MSHKAKLLRACAWNRCTLLMPTSAQHVQVGPVSKDGATQLSWLTDQVAFSFYMSSTNLTMAARPCVICSLSPLFFWSYLPWLSSTISLQHGGLLGISQAHQPAASFQPCIGFFLLYLHRSSWDPPHAVPHGLQGFAQMSPSQQANPGHLLKILICLYFTWAFLISNPFPCAICHHTTV